VALPLFIRVINVINSVIGVPLHFPSLHIRAVNGVAGAPLPFPSVHIRAVNGVAGAPLPFPLLLVLVDDPFINDVLCVIIFLFILLSDLSYDDLPLI
jgi:hypothetical protein